MLKSSLTLMHYTTAAKYLCVILITSYSRCGLPGGHSASTQVLFLVLGPRQLNLTVVPSSHKRFDILIPVPQVTEHVVHSDHVFQCPHFSVLQAFEIQMVVIHFYFSWKGLKDIQEKILNFINEDARNSNKK